MMRTLDSLMRRFTIRTRMLGAIVIVLGLMGVVGVAGLVGGATLKTLNDHFMDHAVSELQTVMRVHDAMNAAAIAEKQMVIDYEDGVAVLKSREAWQKAIDEARAHLRSMTEGDADEDNALATEALAALDRYVGLATGVMNQLQDGGYDNARVADRLLARAHKEFAAVRAGIDRITGIVETEAQASHDEIRDTIMAIGVGYGALLLVTMSLVVPLTLLNSRSIVQPVRHARKVAQAIARGDLRTPIRVEGRDEASDLLEALAGMQVALHGMVGSMRQAADSIRTASAEVATGNADLSGRTEQTAGSLQQAASAMEHLTGTVRQTAESARTANQLASSAAEVASRGGQVVEQVVSTMGQISEASRRIGDIIGTIDGIAFQTNILALNAAVEAARAGEQGRGFAVVAGEVRQLAQRSAEAAREIKGLIGASVDKVESGSRLVGDAGQTMTEIVASVQRVVDMIGEITAAATEQSEGIGQVNDSVTQLDRMTQQNAALVEQSAAAAESLKDQARVLAGLVERFELDASVR